MTGRYLMPGERAFRRVLQAMDGDALDAAACGYAADVVRGDAPAPHVAAGSEPVEREQLRNAAETVGGAGEAAADNAKKVWNDIF